jgi:hypothetical protein
MKMGIGISQVEQDLISTSLERIPPESWLVGCTPAQQLAWEEVKEDITKIHDELKAYFFGDDYSLEGEQKEDEYWDLVQWYLAFYQLVRVGMTAIRMYANECDFPFEYSTPGAVLIEVLHQRAKGSFHYLAEMPYYRHPSRRRYDLRLSGEKLRESWEQQQQGESLSHSESRALKAYEKEVKNQNQGLERFTVLERFCRQACQEYLKIKASKALKEALTHYQERKKIANKWSKSGDRSGKSFVIERGNLKIGQVGGTYQ